MNNYMSVSTISSPEFINLEPLDVSPFISKCDIKVFYLGKNRNGSVINKDTAIEMAKTLRGNPIVGYYKKDKEDFFDHGKEIKIDGEGVHFSSLTRPYGFVAPNANVWFQDFEDHNPDGSIVLRTYLMTNGYLWTQYEEAKQVIEEGGKPHSMEIDEKTLDGYWTNDFNSGKEFFIINDAIFSKLCMLGDDVEPCFEGSSITPSQTSANFTLDKQFTKTLYTMMKELQETLQGGKSKVEEQNKDTLDFEAQKDAEAPVQETETKAAEAEAPAVEEPTPEAPAVEETPAAEFEKNEDNSVESSASENEVNIEEPSVEFEKKEEEKEESKEENKEDSDEKQDDNKEDDEKKKAKEDYSLLKTEYDNLVTEYNTLKDELIQLREYKAAKENEAKDALIAEFYMLSDEDKKDVIENKTSYSLDEIKSKLAVICYDKKINYTAQEKETATNPLDEVNVNIQSVDSTTPEWLQAVDRHMGR